MAGPPTPLSRVPALRDLLLLAARVALGAVFIAHGRQKATMGIDRVAAFMSKDGVPLPRAAATYATVVEFAAGVAFIVGVAVSLAALLVFLDILGAFIWVHHSRGLLGPGGYELVLVLGIGLVLLAISGPGRLSVDGLVDMARRTRRGGGAAARTPSRGPTRAPG